MIGIVLGLSAQLGLSQENTFYTNAQVSISQSSNFAESTLYIGGDLVASGDKATIQLSGKLDITGHLLNNVSAGNFFSFSDEGLVRFCGSEEQRISGTADKTLHYIAFPSLRIENSQAVYIDPGMGIEVNGLELQRGRLILGSKVGDEDSRYVESAHLLVKEGGSVSYNRDAELKEEKGIVQVELALGDNYQHRRLVGFSSPFKRIYADYFMYNFLSKPSPSGLFGDTGSLITNIMTAMNAGEGYLVGQGIIEDEEHYGNMINPDWSGAEYSDRATENFRFNREFMPESFSQYNTKEDRFEGEAINIEDVYVSLSRQGFNYLGNPFTTPLDMSSFLKETSVPDEWGVTRSASADGGDFRNSFYVISGGEGEYDTSSRRFTFTVSYLLGQEVGGTLSYDGSSSYQIAPMQLFVVGKNGNTASEFIIPASARSHGPASFFKSPVAPAIDEIMIEIIDRDTKGYDRLCIVFREEASLLANDRYDAVKIFNLSGGVSQIYTRSSNNKKMTANVVPASIRSLDLYLSPSDKKREVSLSAYRLSGLETIETVLLEDKFTNEIINLREVQEYRFTTSPGDMESRFVLHFADDSSTEILPPADQIPFVAYSFSNRIYIKGVKESDLQGRIIVTDMQGRMLYNDLLTEYPEIAIDKYFERGVYIVRLAGVRDKAAKVIVK